SQFNDQLSYHIADITPQVLTLSPEDYLTNETDTGVATVKQLITSVVPEDLPLVALDANGNIVPSSGGSLGSVFRAGDLVTGLAQQASFFDRLFPVFSGITAHATATVQILGNANIESSGNVDIESSATSSGKVSVPSVILGAAYADSEARSHVT